MGRAQQQALSGLCESGHRTNQRGTARGQNICSRTSVFRRSVENQCIIDLIDENGNHASAVQGGWMNITSHESVLAMLENRASRFSNRGSICGVDNNLVPWALDETRTIDTSFLCNNNENSEQIALAEQHKKTG
jgi:hypothetical protein